jgi:adenylosuccinate synthase
VDYNGNEPVYKEYDGWKKSIVGINNYDDLPDNAKKYIKDIESFLDIPIDIISNGPGREENIILKNIF